LQGALGNLQVPPGGVALEKKGWFNQEKHEKNVKNRKDVGFFWKNMWI
jgi:hypothetical protein